MKPSRMIAVAFLGAAAAALTLLLPAPVLADAGLDHQIGLLRPIQLGTSGGNINDRSSLYCCSGTLGALVQDGSGNQYILSNNHVLARSSAASLGEPINQPGQIDQNCAQDGVVADLADFIKIQYSKGRKVKINEVDAAIALVRAGQVDASGAILDVGTVSANTVLPFVGQPVQKSGRTTGHTFGSVVAVDVTVDVGYSKECGGASNQISRFVNQIRIADGSFSGGGDSGSLIVESGSADPGDGLPRAVGLLFAGSSTSTIANPIDTVLSLLGVTMVSGPPPPPPASGSISGVVTSAAGGSPIAGASVSSDTGQSTTTGSDGAYRLTNVPIGNRTVSVSAAGFESQSQPVSVTEGVESPLDFVLETASVPSLAIANCIVYDTEGGRRGDRHLLITARVVDDFGNPVSGAQVDIDVLLDGSSFGSASGTTGSTGEATFTAKNAPSGVYESTIMNITAAALSFEGTTPANAFSKGSDAVPAEYCRAGASSSETANTARGPAASLQNARAINGRNSEFLFDVPGVVGHGVGFSNTGAPQIEVYLGANSASARAAVPAALEGVPVRVIVTGRFEAF